MTNLNKQETCEDRIASSLASCLYDLRIMFYGPTVDDIELVDDGTMDTVIRVLDSEFRFSDTSDYRDSDGTLDLVALFEDERLFRDMRERFYEYGLSFDYVAAGTFTDQDQAYFRYQLSWGGPSTEFRFYVNPDLTPYSIEYWYLDWFDGASRRLHGADYTLLAEIFGDFAECGTVRRLIEEA